MIDPALIEACAPNVAVETIQAIVQVESQGDPLALGTNRPGGAITLHAIDLAEAVQLATREIRAGNSVDIGLMQVNSKNFPKLGITLPQAFNPCVNVRAGAAILTGAYVGAAKVRGDGQEALRAALSAYNTGDYSAGFNNGYVARYYEHRSVTRSIVNSSAEVYSADPTVFIRNPREQEQQPMTEITSKPVIVRDVGEFLTKGVQVELDPDAAEDLGVNEESALSESDAWASQDSPSHFDRAGLATKGDGHGH
jgi:type IV secretion system protein VirB1